MTAETMLAGWAPSELTTVETITAEPSISFAALLDKPSPASKPGDALPPLWHWFHFLAYPSQSELGVDGHPVAGAFMPPIPNRRRMFGGGRVTQLNPLRVGATVTRTSAVTATAFKTGSSGPMIFVTVGHRFEDEDGVLLVSEEQDLIYRQGDTAPRVASSSAADLTAEPDFAPWQADIDPDPTLLFRFSALTNNAHRIHYDLDYARTVEGFAGLVVHGPLSALLMLELPRRHAPDRAVRSFDYRALRPAFSGRRLAARGQIDAGGRQCVLQVHSAGLTMTGSAELHSVDHHPKIGV